MLEVSAVGIDRYELLHPEAAPRVLLQESD